MRNSHAPTETFSDQKKFIKTKQKSFCPCRTVFSTFLCTRAYIRSSFLLSFVLVEMNTICCPPLELGGNRELLWKISDNTVARSYIARGFSTRKFGQSPMKNGYFQCSNTFFFLFHQSTQKQSLENIALTNFLCALLSAVLRVHKTNCGSGSWLRPSF